MEVETTKTQLKIAKTIQTRQTARADRQKKKKNEVTVKWNECHIRTIATTLCTKYLSAQEVLLEHPELVHLMNWFLNWFSMTL